MHKSMKTRFKLLFSIFVAMLCCAVANAHDFVVKNIYYNITSDSNYTVNVTFKGTSYTSSKIYEGNVEIPSTVTYNSKVYSVTGI